MIHVTTRNLLRAKSKLLLSIVRCFSYSQIHLNNNTLLSRSVKLAFTSFESVKDAANSEKPPILIMHGLFGSKNNWNTIGNAIHQRTDRKVILIDARNHGDSPHSLEMSYKHMAQDIVQLLNDLGFQKSLLIGHSMGGSTMMYVALNFPEYVEKLLVVDMSPVRSIPDASGILDIFKALRKVTLEGSPSLTNARKMADKQLESTIKSLAVRQFLTMNLVEAEPGKYKWRINLPILEQFYMDEIAVFPNVGSKTFTGPTLFVGGANSNFIPVEDHEKIQKLFPSAEFQYIAGAAHWVHADKPAEFVNISTTFINQIHL